MMLWLVGLSFAADRALIAQLDREVIALQQRVEVLETALASCAVDDTPPAIYAELVQIYAGGPVKVSRTGLVTQITLPVDLLMVSGGNRLREEATPTLDLLATALKLHPELQVTVIAYADADEPSTTQRKTIPTAWELTALRATAVARALIEQYSVPAERVTVAGRGTTHPIADNDTTEGRAQNRRIVIEIRPGDAP